METFKAIFTQLGVDSSLLPQLFVIIAIFAVAHFLFLSKLQNVLEKREESTFKLENSADETVEKVNKMQAERKLKIDEAHRQALKVLTDKKQEITQKYTNQYKSEEKEVSGQVDKARNDFQQEIASNKDKFLSEADTLAQTLVQKILQ
ncbi:MAG: hypothetical protein AB7I27_04580 [Bacteriovoracaceae bacterium]